MRILFRCIMFQCPPGQITPSMLSLHGDILTGGLSVPIHPTVQYVHAWWYDKYIVTDCICPRRHRQVRLYCTATSVVCSDMQITCPCLEVTCICYLWLHHRLHSWHMTGSFLPYCANFTFLRVTPFIPVMQTESCTNVLDLRLLIWWLKDTEYAFGGKFSKDG